MPEISVPNANDFSFLSAQIRKDKRLPDFIRSADVFRKEKSFNKIFKYLGLQEVDIRLRDVEISKDFIKFQRNHFVKANNTYDPDASIIERIKSHIKRLKCTYPNRFNLDLAVAKDYIKHYNKADSICSIIDIPINERRIVFTESSYWDIATMSMRGISSCQRWDNGNAKCLVGSIVDPCCGVIYMTDCSYADNTLNSTKMLYRSVVRFIIHQKIGPALFLERIYGGRCKFAVSTIFAQILHDKTGLPILTYDYPWNMEANYFHTSMRNNIAIPMHDIMIKYDFQRSYSDANINYVTIDNNIIQTHESLEAFKNYFLAA